MAEFDFEGKKWTRVTDHSFHPGGDLIKEGDRLYYIGGIDPETGYKSKVIHEYEGTNSGWKKWKLDLPVPKEMKNSWSIMRIGPKFCQSTKKNVTRTTRGLDAWHFNGTDTFRYFHYFDKY